jgi:V8-like Glu-specific endopeptidase
MRKAASLTVSASVLLLGAVAAGCGGIVEGAEPDEDSVSETSEAIIGTQRSAAAYSEAVLVKVNNSYGDFCSGVLIAPQVVLTAAHCVVFNPGGTWTITAPFTTAGSKTLTARSGEPMDAAFRAVNYWDYETHTELHDLGVVYLDAAFPGVKYPSLSATQYPSSTAAAPVRVSAIGRQYVGVSAGLVRSARVTLSRTNASDGYLFTYKTARVTDGGDSGGPLFIEGTHKLVGTEALFDPSKGLDFWARLDGPVNTWITARVTTHGGWGPSTSRW